MKSLVVALVLLWVAGTARAEDFATYDADGDADAGGADPRVAALDEAFGKAVALALIDIVTAEVRGAKKAELDREIIARARLWGIHGGEDF